MKLARASTDLNRDINKKYMVPLFDMLQSFIMKSSQNIRKTYVDFYFKVLEQFALQRSRFQLCESLIVHQLVSMERCDAWLSMLALLLFSFVLYPFQMDSYKQELLDVKCSGAWIDDMAALPNIIDTRCKMRIRSIVQNIKPILDQFAGSFELILNFKRDLMGRMTRVEEFPFIATISKLILQLDDLQDEVKLSGWNERQLFSDMVASVNSIESNKEKVSCLHNMLETFVFSQLHHLLSWSIGIDPCLVALTGGVLMQDTTTFCNSICRVSAMLEQLSFSKALATKPSNDEANNFLIDSLITTALNESRKAFLEMNHSIANQYRFKSDSGMPMRRYQHAIEAEIHRNMAQSRMLFVQNAETLMHKCRDHVDAITVRKFHEKCQNWTRIALRFQEMFTQKVQCLLPLDEIETEAEFEELSQTIWPSSITLLVPGKCHTLLQYQQWMGDFVQSLLSQVISVSIFDSRFEGVSRVAPVVPIWDQMLTFVFQLYEEAFSLPETFSISLLNQHIKVEALILTRVDYLMCILRAFDEVRFDLPSKFPAFAPPNDDDFDDFGFDEDDDEDEEEDDDEQDEPNDEENEEANSGGEAEEVEDAEDHEQDIISESEEIDVAEVEDVAEVDQVETGIDTNAENKNETSTKEGISQKLYFMSQEHEDLLEALKILSSSISEEKKLSIQMQLRLMRLKQLISCIQEGSNCRKLLFAYAMEAVVCKFEQTAVESGESTASQVGDDKDMQHLLALADDAVERNKHLASQLSSMNRFIIKVMKVTTNRPIDRLTTLIDHSLFWIEKFLEVLFFRVDITMNHHPISMKDMLPPEICNLMKWFRNVDWIADIGLNISKHLASLPPDGWSDIESTERSLASSELSNYLATVEKDKERSQSVLDEVLIESQDAFERLRMKVLTEITNPVYQQDKFNVFVYSGLMGKRL
jgi:hypothetical protein